MEHCLMILTGLTFVGSILLILAAGLLVKIFFCLSLYKAVKKVPVQHYLFPAWFCWMLLVPVASYVFAWLMLPFGLPKAFEKNFPENPKARSKARELFGIGLAIVILPAATVFPLVNIYNQSENPTIKTAQCA